MKKIKLLLLPFCLLLALASIAPARGAESCCDRAKARGEKCQHKCCLKAAKASKVCEKCNSKDRKPEDFK